MKETERTYQSIIQAEQLNVKSFFERIEENITPLGYWLNNMGGGHEGEEIIARIMYKRDRWTDLSAGLITSRYLNSSGGKRMISVTINTERGKNLIEIVEGLDLQKLVE